MPESEKLALIWSYLGPLVRSSLYQWIILGVLLVF